MNPSPLRWVPESALAHVADAVMSAVATWAQQWSAEAPILVGCWVIESAHARELPATMQPVPGERNGCAAWKLPDDKALGIVPSALGVERTARSALMLELERAAHGALADAIRSVSAGGTSATEANDQSPETGMPLPEHAGPGHWGALVQWKVCGHVCALAVNWDTMVGRAWIQPPMAAPVPKWLPGKVLAGLPVTLTAELGRAQIGVGELAELDEGDVVVLSGPAGRPMRLTVLGSSLELAGQLVQHGEHRAAQMVSNMEGEAR